MCLLLSILLLEFFFNLIEVCLVFYALRCVLSLLFSPHTPPQSIAVHSNPSMLHHHHHHTLLSVPTAPVKEKGCAFFTMPARSLVVAAVVDALPPYPPCCAAARMSSTEALEKVQIKLVTYNKLTIHNIHINNKDKYKIKSSCVRTKEACLVQTQGRNRGRGTEIIKWKYRPVARFSIKQSTCTKLTKG